MSKSQGDSAIGGSSSSEKTHSNGGGDALKLSKDVEVKSIEKITEKCDGESNKECIEKTSEDEMKMLREFITEMEDKISFKLKLRQDNILASENPPDESLFEKLDSNLKKTSAFVKKLKTITETQKDSLMKDCKIFNLTRYIGEIASALVEAKLKMSDVNCVLLVCSLIHQRYPEFSKTLFEHWQKYSLLKKEDKFVNLSKLRVDLRLFADLISVAILPEKEGLNVLYNQLSLLTTNDKEEFNNISIVISFCKHCGDEYAGILSQKIKELAAEHKMTIPCNQFLKCDKQKTYKSLLKEYYQAFSKYVTDKSKELKELEKQNRRMLKTRCELTCERKEKHEICKQNFQKILQNALTFADLLGEPGPHIYKDEIKPEDDAQGDVIFPHKGESSDMSENGLFEDEDTRQFYESLLDLKSLIPGILYKDSEQTFVTNPDIPEEDLEITDDILVDEVKDLKIEEVRPENDKTMSAEFLELDNEEESTVGSSSRELFETYLSNLPNCISRDLVDKAAIEFCLNFNTKINRRKLARTLFGVQRMRHDLLPFYSRLVATLHPCMPGLSAELISFLKDEFNFIMRKKDQINIESKLKIVRFLGELTKFQMFSKSEALFCLKRFINDFKHHNIEMACSFLEICGRYLYRSPESYYILKKYLDVMMRKKAALHLDTRYITMIENAYYYSNPPENTKRETLQKLPPMHQYIERLLFKDLSKITVEKVLKQMRKLNWNDIELRMFVIKSFSSIWKAKYNCIHCCANLVSGLCHYQEEVCYQIVDSVLENIRLGMEMNHPKYNQNRLSLVKYLGELYNFKVIESQVIFKTLYSFITFETSLDASNPSPYDPPEYLFRIRLIYVLLETSGCYFNTGMSKKRLDCFLVYFQRYYWFKKSNPIWTEEFPFPKDIENLVADIFHSLRPKMIPSQSWEEANRIATELDEECKTKFVRLIKDNQNDSSQGELNTIMESESEDIEDDTITPKRSQDSEFESPATSPKEYGDSEYEMTEIQESEDETLFVPCKPKLIKCEEDDDFLAAFDKMMSETIQTRQQEIVKIPPVEIAVPIKLQSRSKTYANPIVETGDAILFTVLTRKGNKPQLTKLPVPTTETFAAKFKEQKKFELAEKEKMKKVVLEIHERQEEEHYQAEMLAQQQITGPRDRRNFHHQRGVPNTDAIFGSKKR